MVDEEYLLLAPVLHFTLTSLTSFMTRTALALTLKDIGLR